MSSTKKALHGRRLTITFRLIVAAVFVFSGFTKLMLPPEEFAEIIRSYHVVPQAYLYPLALVIPWVELLSGVFLLIGLFIRIASALISVQLAFFMVILSVVLVRGINLEDCGCFAVIGFKETPLQALIRDAVLLTMTLIFLSSGNRALSLDSGMEDEVDS